MPHQLIRFHGTYRYDSPESLERALAAARSQLDDEDVTDPALGSLRTFIKAGSVLRVDVELPSGVDVRFAAAGVFQALALDAVEGAVEARDLLGHVDFFPSGGDD